MAPSRLTAFAALLASAGAVRISEEETSLAADTGAAEETMLLADTLKEGALFAGRFRMKHVLWRKALANGSRLEHIPLPVAMAKRFTNEKELQAGSFGETWGAYDTQTQRPVALKMFYSTGPSGRYFLTWAQAAGKQELQDQLSDAAGECLTAMKMQLYATSDPVGASRLMQCYEDHVTCEECARGQPSGKSTTNHDVQRNEPLYQILEDCAGEGGKGLDKWIQTEVGTYQYEERAIFMFKELVEGLAYLTAPDHDIKWVHHDLKPENTIVKVLGGREYMKLIDFGSVTQITHANNKGTIPSTPTFAPPEWFKGTQFTVSSPASFDMYGAGSILNALFTGVEPTQKLMQLLPSSAQMVARGNCAGAPQDQRAGCEGIQLVIQAKQMEPGITGQWLTSMGMQQGMSMLYGPTGVMPNYARAASYFVKSLTSLHPLQMQMIAPVPSQRPTGQDVLADASLKLRPTSADPDFNAEEAQANGELALKKSGGGGGQVVSPVQPGGQYANPLINPAPLIPGGVGGGHVGVHGGRPQGHVGRPQGHGGYQGVVPGGGYGGVVHGGGQPGQVIGGGGIPGMVGGHPPMVHGGHGGYGGGMVHGGYGGGYGGGVVYGGGGMVYGGGR